MLESIISLAILSLGLFSLTTTYVSSLRATKKFSEPENLAYCLRTAAMALQKNTDVPKQIVLNNITYRINVIGNKIKATGSNQSMEINWYEK